MITPNMSEESGPPASRTIKSVDDRSLGSNGNNSLRASSAHHQQQQEKSASGFHNGNERDGQDEAKDREAEEEDEDHEYEDDRDTPTTNEWKQHLVAVAVAAVAAIIGFPFLSPVIDKTLMSWTMRRSGSSGGGSSRSSSRAGMSRYHDMDGDELYSLSLKPTYKRTLDLNFTLSSSKLMSHRHAELRNNRNPSTSSSDVYLGVGGDDNDVDTRTNWTFDTSAISSSSSSLSSTDLIPFTFYVPSTLVSTLLSYYVNEYDISTLYDAGFPTFVYASSSSSSSRRCDNNNDNTGDDSSSVFSSSWSSWNRRGGGKNQECSMSSDLDRWVDSTLSSTAAPATAAGAGGGSTTKDSWFSTVSTLRISSMGYVTPPVHTFYRDDYTTRASPDRIGGGIEGNGREPGLGEKDVKEVMKPLFTGFAAKFINLSNRPLDLYWDYSAVRQSTDDDDDDDDVNDETQVLAEKDKNGSSDSGLKKKRRKTKRQPHKKIATIAPFEAVGTGTFNGHQFHLTPSYDSTFIIYRFTVTKDDPVQAYDPYISPPSSSSPTEYQIDKLTPDERHRYNIQRLNLSYMRDYAVATKRPWLAMFPRRTPIHFMWSANTYGHIHRIHTRELHFHTLPTPSEMNKDVHVAAADEEDIVLSNYRRLSSSASSSSHALSNQGDGNAKYLTLTMTAISCAPRVFEIPHFLSDVEADHLVSLATAADIMTESTVSAASATGDGSNPQQAQRDVSSRSSENGWIQRGASPIVDAIYRRAADVLRIDESLLRDRFDQDESSSSSTSTNSLLHQDRFKHNHSNRTNAVAPPIPLVEQSSMAEPLQIVHYQVNQQYTAHHDFTFPASQNVYQPTRFATMLLYLNDDYEGGQTVFPKVVSSHSSTGVQVLPEKGKAVLFYNLLPDGNMDDLSQHAALPVTRGEKWLANLWVWDPLIS